MCANLCVYVAHEHKSIMNLVGMESSIIYQIIG